MKNSYQIGVLKVVLGMILCAVCIGLVIAGQRVVSYGGLAMQIVGLIGLLVELFLYNRKYQ